MPPLQLAPEQPYGVTMTTADGVCVVQMVIPRAGTLVPQHLHTYEHTTMLAVGRAVLVVDGDIPRLVSAPDSVTVPAGTQHSLLSVDDGVVAYCIHNTHGTGAIDVAAEACIGCTLAPGPV